MLDDDDSAVREAAAVSLTALGGNGSPFFVPGSVGAMARLVSARR